MNSFIPFVATEKDCAYLRKYYADVECVRVSLPDAPEVTKHLPKGKQLWLDPSLDGFCGPQASEHKKPKLTEVIKEAVAEGTLGAGSTTKESKPRRLDWIEFVKRYKHHDKFFSDSFLIKPDKRIVEEFVFAVLDECRKYAPTWLSVPQLPHEDDASRNKINRALAEATGKWRSKSGFDGRLIVPAIFCSKAQLAGKTARNAKVKAVLDSLEKSSAHGVWTVDVSLSDWEGSDSFIRERFPAVIALQTELNASASMPTNALTIAGPYWGMNVLLWARELVQYAAISLGNSWKYNISGGIYRSGGNNRIMIEHLRRPVDALPALEEWFEKAITVAVSSPEAQRELMNLRAKLKLYQVEREEARSQLNSGYRAWLDLILGTPDKGRAIALYQDFSQAYVFGHTLSDLPIDAVGRKPGQVAKTFMLNCLGH